jgi:hypothetical protein
MPNLRSQWLKILNDNKTAIDEAEKRAAEETSDTALEAEGVRYLAVLRKNVVRIEKMLNEPNER